jgi:hypothetical protein
MGQDKNLIKTTIREFLNENKFSNLLLQMVKDDQSERRHYSNFVLDKFDGNYERAAKEYAKLKNRSFDDIFGDKERMEKFIPIDFDFNSFSDEDWENYWLMSQHADMYPNFQKKALNVIEKYLGLNNELYYYLYDRISCRESGTQKYGTQDIC